MGSCCPGGAFPPKPRCKKVKILVKTHDNSTSPMETVSPCGGYESLPLRQTKSPVISQQSSSSICSDPRVCEYHSRFQEACTETDPRFCCTPTTECDECKCGEPCIAHAPTCPHYPVGPLRARIKNSARVDPDPLE